MHVLLSLTFCPDCGFYRSGFWFVRAPVQHCGILASFVKIIPMMNLSVDLVPLFFAFDLGTVINIQGSISKVAKSQDRGMLLVAMIPVRLTT